jgi:hypothetical protein
MLPAFLLLLLLLQVCIVALVTMYGLPGSSQMALHLLWLITVESI